MGVGQNRTAGSVHRGGSIKRSVGGKLNGGQRRRRRIKSIIVVDPDSTRDGRYNKAPTAGGGKCRSVRRGGSVKRSVGGKRRSVRNRRSKSVRNKRSKSVRNKRSRSVRNRRSKRR